MIEKCELLIMDIPYELPGFALDLRAFHDGALLAKMSVMGDMQTEDTGVVFEDEDADLLDNYIHDFGQYGIKYSVGTLDLHRMRLTIAHDVNYTDRCRKHPLFQDCFDNGELRDE